MRRCVPCFLIHGPDDVDPSDLTDDDKDCECNVPGCKHGKEKAIAGPTS